MSNGCGYLIIIIIYIYIYCMLFSFIMFSHTRMNLKLIQCQKYDANQNTDMKSNSNFKIVRAKIEEMG